MLNNISPKIWGQAYWDTIYYVVMSYPIDPTDDDKIHVRDFFEKLQHILPCETCRYHYSKHLTATPLTDEVMSSNQNLLKWIININNDVNRRTGKNEVTIDYIIKHYTYTPHDYSKYFHIVIVILMIIVLSIIIIYIKFT